MRSETLSAWLLIVMLLALPIFKAGMMSGVLPVFIVSSLLVLILTSYWLMFSVPNGASVSAGSYHILWFSVWFVFSIGVALHLWILPDTLGWNRYFGSKVDFAALSGLEPLPVNSLRTVSVWGFFTSMWVIAWRASLLSVRHIQHLILVIFFASLFQACFGVLHLLSESESILGLWDKKHYLRDATGTFVNRNHFANFLAVSWPVALSGLLSDRPLLFGNFSLKWRVVVALLFSILIMTALLLSHSRMGTTAALIGVLVWAVFFVRRAQRFSQNITKWLPVIILTAVCLFVVWYGVGDIFDRFLLLADGDSRIDKWLATFNLPAVAWLYGIGPGGFEDVFALVQPEHQQLRYLYAHNDYLEFILEFGLVISTVISLALFVLVYKLWPVHWGSLTIAAAASILIMIIHSLVDFSLQIPGSALLFWLVFGLFVNQRHV